MILTGKEIRKQVRAGRITIDPFIPDLMNPNSYNYRLGEIIKIPIRRLQSVGQPGIWRTIRLSDDGYILSPGTFYLGHTLETLGSSHFVPILIGRSSLGRLGLFLQIDADLGQLGLRHRWTLELTAVQPIRIYPRMRIGQVSFWKPQGKIKLYDGRYVNTDLPTPSRFSSC
jgi:dCTP deaminase